MDDRREDSEGSDPQTNQSQPPQGREERLRAAFQFLALALGSGTFDPTRPDHGRASVRNALIGVIAVIAELFPDKPSLPATLNHLLYALWDLDRGKVPPLLQPAKIEHSPGLSLAEDLFRALPSAAMTRLMEGRAKLVLIANDDLIAGILNRNGLKTGNGNRWTRERVTSTRSNYRIPVFRPAEDGMEPWLNLSNAAKLLQIAPKTLRLAAEAGEIKAIHPLPDGPWIYARAELTTSAARSITERARQNPRYPAGSHPRQQSLFSSIT